MWYRILAVTLGLGVSAPTAAEAAEIQSRQVRFARGAESATINGTVKGDQTIDYKLRGRAGQTMSVTMETSHTASYFNVLPPGSNDVALFVGSTSGNKWSDTLPADGEYKIRVYLMRSAARRNETARFKLNIAITGGAPASDAKVAGTPFHATGQVPCALGNAAPGAAQCDFGVIRGGAGRAAVHVTAPGGARRILTFRGNSVTVAGGAKVAARKINDEWLITIDERERYRIPEAVVSGG